MQKLHNDHNVYILGAGFSAGRGYPVVKNFMFEMRDAYDWLRSCNRMTEADAIEKVLGFRQEAAAAAYRVKIDLENIEELFSLASASAGFSRSKDLSRSIRIAIAATLDYCKNNKPARNVNLYSSDPLEWYDQYRMTGVEANGSCWYQGVPAYQHYLRSMLGYGNTLTGENTILSFNYDTLVEEALTSMNLGFSYGFKAQTVNYRTSTLNLSNQKLKLLKLHGSVNWAHLEQAKQGAGKLTIFDSYDAVRAANAVPDLIPPTWRKVFDGNLEGVWDNAIDAIKSATRIFVIGFSVPETDNHFKYLLASGLQDNISLRDVVFVNPDAASDFKTRIGNLFAMSQNSRLSFAAEYAESYLGNLANKDNTNRGFLGCAVR